MSVISSLKKVADKAINFVQSNLLGVIVAAIIIYLLMNYGNLKASVQSGMSNGDNAPTVSSAPKASVPDNEYQSVEGISTSTHGLPPSCMKQSTMDPKELLPKDANSDWASLNPSGSGELSDVNLLKAGSHIGINTVGQSLRNSNLQIRSEPPNPQMNVGPWHQTTMEPDHMRVPLELGQGGQ
jgi:hypothetical protein